MTRRRHFSRRLRGKYRRFCERFFLDYSFIHINRTGGSSTTAALKLPFEHKTAVEKITSLGEKEWNRRFTFSFVRNPWDRVASQYFHRLGRGEFGSYDKRPSFEQWVLQTYDEENPVFVGKPRMFMPQLRWLADSDGQVRVDFVGRFERLQEDFDRICRKIGKRTVVLPHWKKSENADYQSAHTAETKEVVAAWFAEDIAEFGYTFRGT